MIKHLSNKGRFTTVGICAMALLLTFRLAHAQEIDVTVRAGFLADSLKIGEETAYYLSARYPRDLTVLFPDSTHAFLPFEYVDREYFPTQTAGGISVDSTVFYLTTFEVDRVQRLRLPAYVVRGSDSTIVEPQGDSILVTQFVAEVPDTVAVEALPLRMNTSYQKVFYQWNVWMITLAAAVVITAVVIVWLLFGKKIKKYFVTRRLQRNHATFLERYNTFLHQLRSTSSPPATESALVTWKKYMEQLESRPYTKLTTRETQRLLQEPALGGALSHIDRAIYGHDTGVLEPLESLRSFADQQYRRKLKEVQHG